MNVVYHQPASLLRWARRRRENNLFTSEIKRSRDNYACARHTIAAIKCRNCPHHSIVITMHHTWQMETMGRRSISIWFCRYEAQFYSFEIIYHCMEISILKLSMAFRIICMRFVNNNNLWSTFWLMHCFSAFCIAMPRNCVSPFCSDVGIELISTVRLCFHMLLPPAPLR